jgi:hypothetical protein
VPDVGWPPLVVADDVDVPRWVPSTLFKDASSDVSIPTFCPKTAMTYFSCGCGLPVDSV